MWYILNFIQGKGHSRNGLNSIIANFNAVEKSSLELFAPTYIQLTEDKGKVKRSEKTLLFHYVFVKGEEDQVKKLCHTTEGFSFILDHSSGTRRYLMIPDEDLERFKIIAKYYSGQLPCIPLEGAMLEEGDKVQVVSGPFAGLEGTYVSRKGGKSGNIVIAVAGAMAAVAYDVPADYVRVLEFSHDSKRIYDQLDAFALKILPLLPKPGETPGGIDRETRRLALAGVFTTRLGVVRLNNPKVDAKLQILLYAAYRILGEETKASASLDKLSSLKKEVTNRWTLGLCLAVLKTFAPDSGLTEEIKARWEVSKDPKSSSLSKLQSEIMKAL